MSHSNSNSNSWFEQYFEDRLAEIEPFLRNWANARYSTLDEATRDEALQRTRITLWEQFQGDPEAWAARSPRTWTRFAQAVYPHSLYDKKERVIQRRFTTASDLENERIRQGDADVLDLLRGRSPDPRRETREIHLAELRVDLELAIRRGMALIDSADRDDMRKLMTGIMQSYSLREIAQRHSWSSRRAARLNMLLRTVFYQALTGQARDQQPHRRAASQAELALLKKLAGQNLSSRKIAAQMGRSTAWAHDHVTRLKRADLAPADDLVRFAVDELGGVLCEGSDWPRSRDGEDLAPVLVDA